MQPGAPLPARPTPLDLELPERAKQRRWTVLIRGILLIPLLVVTTILFVATVVCSIVGWFVALVTGRAPEFLRTVVTTFLRLDVRLRAYGFLLTDRFPPYSFEEAPRYRASVVVPPATKLNRASVLFRFILLIPAYVVVSLAEDGLLVIGIVGWAAAVITGWLPTPFHDAYRAFVRFRARTIAYICLLVPTYPSGLFGERPASLETGAQASVWTIVGAASVPSRRLVLGAGGKRLVVIAIILGIPTWVLLHPLPTSDQPAYSNQQAFVQANNRLVDDMAHFKTAMNNCTTVPCLEQANETFSNGLAAFVSNVRVSGDPGTSAGLTSQLVEAAQNAEHATAAMAVAGPTLTDFKNVAVRVHADQRLNELTDAQNKVAVAYNGSHR
jgi:hypothetical protein